MENQPAASGRHSETWAQAQKTLQSLISQVESLHADLVRGHRNLVWQGPAEEEFQRHAAGQDSYLSGNLKILEDLHMWATYAEGAKSDGGASL